MTEKQTRRAFLKITAASAAGLAVTETSPAETGPTPTGDRTPGEIAVRVTAGDERFAAQPPIAWRRGRARADAIMLNPRKRHQTILGFGAAFTDAACYMFNQLPPEARKELFHQFFHPSQMGLNVCRICIGSSDYAQTAYSYAEQADPELKNFSIEHDRGYILPILREARTLNPNLSLLASPWSPPGWMKFNNSMLGGSMRRKHLATYADYFLKFLRAYQAEDVPVQFVSPQNEVDTDQDGRMPACIWPQEYEIEFVRDHLGPALQKHGVDTKVWLIDHNYNLWGRAMCELEDEGVRKYAGGIAWHGYAGTPDMMAKVAAAYPEVGMYWTEGGPDWDSPSYATEWSRWAATFTDVLRNWSRCVIAWNLALDERGRPNIGPFNCGGLVTVHSQTKEITYSGQYWALAHFSSAVRRGAYRIASESEAAVRHVAFENPDGGRVLILTNPASSTTAQVRLGEYVADVKLSQDSAATLSWR